MPWYLARAGALLLRELLLGTVFCSLSFSPVPNTLISLRAHSLFVVHWGWLG